MKYSDLLNRSVVSAHFSHVRTVFAVGLFLIMLPELAIAQECTVSGGTVVTISPTSNICLNDSGSHLIELTVSGNVGIGRFGLVEAGTGNVVAVNTSGLFEMINYPPGNYLAGHVSVQEASTLSGVTKINELMGCYDLSNVITVGSIMVDGGSISAMASTNVSGGMLPFEVSGANGPNQRWVLLNQQASSILVVQTEGIFDFDVYPDGTYRVAHGSFGSGINLNELDPQNLQGCIDASNLVTVVKNSGQVLGPGEVYNPITGRIWKDRNLGASQVATSSTDAAAYGDLYQWGRGADGHQIRTSTTTTSLSNSDTPGHGSYILATNSPHDWRSPQNNNLWQGVSGINNPCSEGFRLPTEVEWNEEILSWTSNNTTGAFASPLKLTAAGYRHYSSGALLGVGSGCGYWSSTVSGTNSRYLLFHNSSADMLDCRRADGFSVRCIKD